MKVPLDVLIVEDSETDAKLVMRQLRRSGYEPRSERVETGPQLKAALQKRKWQLVLSDSAAPGLGVMQALSMVRELQSGVPFIIVSGSPPQQAADEALRAGAVAFVSKDDLARIGPLVAQLNAGARGQAQALDAERRRIARELHDEVGQLLTSIKLLLEAAQRESGERRESHLAEAHVLISQAIVQVRDFSLVLWPTILDELGLAAALRWLASRQERWSGLAFQIDVQDIGPLPQETAVAAFRIAQEAVTNVVRHARGSKVTVGLKKQRRWIEVTVADDGRGFDAENGKRRAESGGGLGIAGMQERATLAGGQLDIESAKGRGTTVRARFPLRGGRAT
ncbi:MAG TPA: ATP-binding protein [Myxococcales bacterium]|nr:ATP-binding protein [Myxococcales bacterium]